MSTVVQANNSQHEHSFGKNGHKKVNILKFSVVLLFFGSLSGCGSVRSAVDFHWLEQAGNPKLAINIYNVLLQSGMRCPESDFPRSGTRCTMPGALFEGIDTVFLYKKNNDIVVRIDYEDPIWIFQKQQYRSEFIDEVGALTNRYQELGADFVRFALLPRDPAHKDYTTIDIEEFELEMLLERSTR